MKKFLMILCAVMLVFGMVGTAMATPVTFDVEGSPDSYVSFTSTHTGIFGFGTDTSISATLADLDTVPDFTLNDGDSKIIDFFTFEVEGNGIGFFDLDANLNFDTPPLDAGGPGSGGWGAIGSYSGGIFLWDDSTQDFTLADGNVVEIAMEDGFALGEGNEVTVHATITNNGGGVAPVPEPSTILLLGLGLIGMAGYGRKRFSKKG